MALMSLLKVVRCCGGRYQVRHTGSTFRSVIGPTSAPYQHRQCTELLTGPGGAVCAAPPGTTDDQRGVQNTRAACCAVRVPLTEGNGGRALEERAGTDATCQRDRPRLRLVGWSA